MDENQKAGQQAGGGVLNLIVNAVLAYYFYQYAYANPDQGECWAAKTSQVPSATATAGFTNVTENFHSWFNWGFYINILALVVGLLQVLAGSLRNEGIAKLAGCLGAPLGCVGLVWFIMGLVWRYQEVGNVCSGDYVLAGSAQDGSAPYAWASGAFINLYYVVIMWTLIGICACACCVGIVMGVAASQS